MSGDNAVTYPTEYRLPRDEVGSVYETEFLSEGGNCKRVYVLPLWVLNAECPRTERFVVVFDDIHTRRYLTYVGVQTNDPSGWTWRPTLSSAFVTKEPGELLELLRSINEPRWPTRKEFLEEVDRLNGLLNHRTESIDF